MQKLEQGASPDHAIRAGAQPEIRNGGLFWGLGAKPPALENFAFFAKIT